MVDTMNCKAAVSIDLYSAHDLNEGERFFQNHCILFNAATIQIHENLTNEKLKTKWTMELKEF